MLVVETIARIRREYFVKGKPIKEIVRDVKVSRNTVRKVIRSQATAFTYDRRVQPMPKLGPWTAELERMLEANETKSKRERLTLLRISEALEGLGYGRPMMSRTLSTKCGSPDSMNVSERCGCKPKAPQMRQIVVCERPLSLAIERNDLVGDVQSSFRQ